PRSWIGLAQGTRQQPKMQPRRLSESHSWSLFAAEVLWACPNSELSPRIGRVSTTHADGRASSADPIRGSLAAGQATSFPIAGRRSEAGRAAVRCGLAKTRGGVRLLKTNVPFQTAIFLTAIRGP